MPKWILTVIFQSRAALIRYWLAMLCSFLLFNWTLIRLAYAGQFIVSDLFRMHEPNYNYHHYYCYYFWFYDCLIARLLADFHLCTNSSGNANVNVWFRRLWQLIVHFNIWNESVERFNHEIECRWMCHRFMLPTNQFLEMESQTVFDFHSFIKCSVKMVQNNNKNNKDNWNPHRQTTRSIALIFVPVEMFKIRSKEWMGGGGLLSFAVF